MSENSGSSNHKPIINVDDDGVHEEIIQKRNMEYKPHICDHHAHEVTANKFKSELKINPNQDEITKNVENQIEQYNITKENRDVPIDKDQPFISTITVQNKQRNGKYSELDKNKSEENRSHKLNGNNIEINYQLNQVNKNISNQDSSLDLEPVLNKTSKSTNQYEKNLDEEEINADEKSPLRQNSTVPIKNIENTFTTKNNEPSNTVFHLNGVTSIEEGQTKLNQDKIEIENLVSESEKSKINMDETPSPTNEMEIPNNAEAHLTQNSKSGSGKEPYNLKNDYSVNKNEIVNAHSHFKETSNNESFGNLQPASSKPVSPKIQLDESILIQNEPHNRKNDYSVNKNDSFGNLQLASSEPVSNNIQLDESTLLQNESHNLKYDYLKQASNKDKFVTVSNDTINNRNDYSVNKNGTMNIVSNLVQVSNNDTIENVQSVSNKIQLDEPPFLQNEILNANSDKDKFVNIQTASNGTPNLASRSNQTTNNDKFVNDSTKEPNPNQSINKESSKSQPSKLHPGLRHVLTQTSVEGARTPSRVGCAESGVLAPRRPAVPPMSSMEQESLRERTRAGLLRRCGGAVHQEARYAKEPFKRLVQSQEFLEQLFKLFDHDGDEQLQQDDWIEFLKERLSDEKQIDFAEQVESVAYVLCGDGPVTLDLFYQIFHAKGIVDKLFRLVDQGNVGTISADQVMEFVSNITNTRPRTGFDKKSLEALEQLFRQTVGNEKEIRREEFEKIVISKNRFFTERVFEIFDKDKSGSISLQEFLDSMHQFAGQSPDDKIKFLFKIYDIDGDGLIQHRELQDVMRACMEENGMQFSEEQLSELTAAMFEDADPGHRGTITYEALKRQLEQHGGLLENLTISIDRWLVPPAPRAPPTNPFARLRPHQLTRPYLKNNYVYLVFLAGFLMLNVGLFVSRAMQYASYGSNGYVIVARACGQCLNFNCMFVLVLMLRQCITFLRTRGFSAVLPLDHHIYLHKVTGMLIAGFSLLHTIMHVLNFSVEVVWDPAVNSGNFTLAEWLLTARPGRFGLVPGLANPTGIALFLILLVMFICSQAFVRRGGCFEIFYWTHLLYIPFWVLLVFHGPNFWKWFIGPGVVYLVERVLRLAWMQSERGKTYISSGLLLPSKVTHLVIKRPLHFDFHPGDYVFVNIPTIAKYEWHPFTISSAPDQEDYMWLHISAVGEWTNRLYNYFEREQEKLHNGEIPPLLPSIGSDTTLRRLQASLKRKFSTREAGRGKGEAQLVRYTHADAAPHVSASDGEIHNRASSSSEALTPEKRLQMLLFHQKVPLEKSLSMPDIQTKAKKRERLLVLREYMRSESEKSFDECQIRRARLQSLGLAYLSPQNKSLAQSFRYMRHKPTIIAFKTPSLENCDARLSSSSLGSVGPSGMSFSPERQAEEGRAVPPDTSPPNASTTSTALSPVNYPVGKPLEPIPEDQALAELQSLIPLERLLGSGTEVNIDIYLDGPYGAPSSHIFRAQHAVLIATGIGVTPFASILQSIMHRYWKARHACPRCGFAWASDIPPTVMHLRKVDFFWINRDQRSFEWFVSLLSQLEIEQAELGGAMERFLDMHMYITSALQKTDMKAVGLQLALDLLHEKEKRDLITGLKTRTNAGRPNWDKVFKQLQDQRKGKVTVFYCGPPQLARILRFKCDQYGFNFRKETF